MKVHRDRYPWRIRERELALGVRTAVMGVLDVGAASSPDSATSVEETVEGALRMQDQGADLIDLTAQPSFASPAIISSDDELRRLVPLLRKLRGGLDIPVSVTTCHADTAERSLVLGASVINDWSGLSFDPRMAEVVNQHDAGLVIGHVRGTPESWPRQPPLPNVMPAIKRDLESALGRARGARIDRRRIVVDPGLEMGKRGQENDQILADLDRLRTLGQPILVSPSGKKFLAESVRSPASVRLLATLAAAAVAVAGGAHIVRVYEVEEIAPLVKTADRILEAAAGQF